MPATRWMWPFLVLAVKYGLHPGKCPTAAPSTGFSFPTNRTDDLQPPLTAKMKKNRRPCEGRGRNRSFQCAENLDYEAVMAQQESLACDGYRVLAVASGDMRKRASWIS